MRVCGWALTAAVATVLLAGCGGGGGSESTESNRAALLKAITSGSNEKFEELSLTLSGYEDAESAGVVLAEKSDYFTKVRLSVDVGVPAKPRRPIYYVSSETADIGISHAPEVVLAQERGAPIVAVGSVISQPTIAMIWLRKSRIDNIADLKGKTIGYPGLPFQKAFLQSVLARKGLTLDDVELKRVGYKLVPALADGRVDAIFGGSWTHEGIDLELRGLQPVITKAASLGLPAYDELVVITRADRLAKNPQSVSNFMSALARSTVAAVEDPRAAIKAIELGQEQDPEASREVTEAEIKATFPLLSKDAYMDPRRASHLINWMYEEGMIQRRLPVSTLFTNRYLGPHP
jgi:putative hydroxymethylpyrimidine transport system substrate-binding protein